MQDKLPLLFLSSSGLFYLFNAIECVLTSKLRFALTSLTTALTSLTSAFAYSRYSAIQELGFSLLVLSSSYWIFLSIFYFFEDPCFQIKTGRSLESSNTFFLSATERLLYFRSTILDVNQQQVHLYSNNSPRQMNFFVNTSP